MTNAAYTLFYRTRTEADPRRRWRKFDEVQATSRSDALRRNITPAADAVIDRSTSCVMDKNGDLILAWPTSRIDFEYYEHDGTFIEAPKTPRHHHKLPAFYLEPGETIVGVWAAEGGGYVVRVRTADGFEGPHDVYPDQDPGPEVRAYLETRGGEAPR